MHKSIALLSSHRNTLGDRTIGEEEQILKYVSEQPLPQSISSILSHFDNEGNFDNYRSALYNLIATFHVFVRIDIQDIFDETNCLVFAERRTSVIWDFKSKADEALIEQIRVVAGEIYTVGDKRMEVLSVDKESGEFRVNYDGEYLKVPCRTLKKDIFTGKAIEADNVLLEELLEKFNIHPTPAKMKRAEKRFVKYKNFQNGEIGLSDSTRRRYKKRYDFGLTTFGQPIYGFIDAGQAGNRSDGHSDTDCDLLVRYVRQSFLRIERRDEDIPECPYAHSRNVSLAHEHYRQHTEKLGIGFYGIKRFKKEIDKVPDEEAERSLKGYKAANRAADPSWPKSVFPHKTYYPGDVAEIDSTVGDARLLGSFGQDIGRVTIAVMCDQFSKMVTAIQYTTEGSGRTLLMMLIQRHVETYEYLPRVIFVDHGSEYDSDYFKMLCFRMDIELRSRPSGNARSGGFCETHFKTLNADFLHNMNGSTRLSVDARDLSPGYRPEDLTTWNLERFDKEIENYSKVYNQTIHSELKGCTPNQLFVAGRKNLTREQKRLCKYDEAFKNLTYIDVERGGTRLVCGGVVRHQGRLYESEELKHVTEKGVSYPVRYNPLDYREVYVSTPSGTVIARLKDAGSLERLTHAQVKRRSIIASSDDLKGKYQKQRRAQMVNFGDHLIEVQANDRKLMRLDEEQLVREKVDGKSRNFDYIYETPDGDEDIRYA